MFYKNKEEYEQFSELITTWPLQDCEKWRKHCYISLFLTLADSTKNPTNEMSLAQHKTELRVCYSNQASASNMGRTAQSSEMWAKTNIKGKGQKNSKAVPDHGVCVHGGGCWVKISIHLCFCSREQCNSVHVPSVTHPNQGHSATRTASLSLFCFEGLSVPIIWMMLQMWKSYLIASPVLVFIYNIFSRVNNQ